MLTICIISGVTFSVFEREEFLKFEDRHDLCKYEILVIRKRKISAAQPVRWSWLIEDKLGVGLG